MDKYESLSPTKWECKYHVVFIPKCRRRTLYEQLRQHLGEVFRELARQKESRVEEGHLMPDHVHMMLAIPPKYAVSQVVGYMKGKSAIHLARVYGERKRNPASKPQESKRCGRTGFGGHVQFPPKGGSFGPASSSPGFSSPENPAPE